MSTATKPRPILPAELSPEDITAVIDPREQLPFDLSPLRTVSGTLATGDYSIVGLENQIAIERKSLPDLVSCVGPERERFERELQRLLGYPCRAVVVEASWAQLEFGGWRSNIKPAAVMGSVCAWISLGIPFVLAGDRLCAEKAAGRILFCAARRRYRELRALAPGGRE